MERSVALWYLLLALRSYFVFGCKVYTQTQNMILVLATTTAGRLIVPYTSPGSIWTIKKATNERTTYNPGQNRTSDHIRSDLRHGGITLKVIYGITLEALRKVISPTIIACARRRRSL